MIEKNWAKWKEEKLLSSFGSCIVAVVVVVTVCCIIFGKLQVAHKYTHINIIPGTQDTTCTYDSIINVLVCLLKLLN